MNLPDAFRLLRGTSWGSPPRESSVHSARSFTWGYWTKSTPRVGLRMCV